MIEERLMEIIHINTPHQGPDTENPQVINNEIPFWTVQTHRTKLGQSLKSFLSERWEYVNKRPGGERIKGFYLYNVEPLGGIVGAENESALFVRIDYIK